MMGPDGLVEEFGALGDDRAKLVPVDLPGGGGVLVTEEVGDELDRCSGVGHDRREGVTQLPGRQEPGRPALAAIAWTNRPGISEERPGCIRRRNPHPRARGGRGPSPVSGREAAALHHLPKQMGGSSVRAGGRVQSRRFRRTGSRAGWRCRMGKVVTGRRADRVLGLGDGIDQARRGRWERRGGHHCCCGSAGDDDTIVETTVYQFDFEGDLQEHVYDGHCH